MDPKRIEHILTHAVTAYDRTRVNRKGYNHYALAQYLRRVDECVDLVRDGMPLGAALEDCFNDRLLTACQKALDAAHAYSSGA